MRVWVTRTQPEADATAARLEALGHDPVVLPVLEARPIAGVQLDLTGVDALAFSSRNGVVAFAALTPRRDLPVFAVGDATAQAARAVGFGWVSSAGGDLGDLSALLARERPGRVLHPGALEPAGEIDGVLALPIYETRETGAVPDGPIDAVLIHSPRAGRAAAAALAGHPEGVSAYAISSAAAAPLEGLNFHLVAVAPYPNEEALLKLLAD